MKTIVIKLGGHAMDDEGLLCAFIQDLAWLDANSQNSFVLVHGGGPQINSLLKRLAIKSEFVDGLRKTDAETLAACEMALCGQVNKDLVRRLEKAGVNAVGISGEDAGLLKAEIKSEKLGLVGRITAVNPDLIERLRGFALTVIAPLATDADWRPLNVNADTAAGAIAAALRADVFILISDVPGVLNQGEVIPRLAKSEILAMIGNGAISGGMIPKAECCLHAIANGCRQAVILDGTKAHALRDFLADGRLAGTLIAGE